MQFNIPLKHYQSIFLLFFSKVNIVIIFGFLNKSFFFLYELIKFFFSFLFKIKIILKEMQYFFNNYLINNKFFEIFLLNKSIFYVDTFYHIRFVCKI